MLINMDLQAPNKVVKEALINKAVQLPGMLDISVIKSETVYGNSRFDFYIEGKNGQKGFVEVKGVTLENDGIASFSDAPTERGVKHLQELVNAKANGFHAYIQPLMTGKVFHIQSCFLRLICQQMRIFQSSTEFLNVLQTNEKMRNIPFTRNGIVL